MKLVQNCNIGTIMLPCILYSIICYISWNFFATNLVEEKMGMCIFATSFYVIISMVFTAIAYVVVIAIQEELFKNLNKD